MTLYQHSCKQPAPGGPGVEPRWTRGDKDAVGTAYATSSALWYTLSRGLITEIYYPTIDRPQVRDLQYLITDGETFVHDERRDCSTEVEPLSEHSLGVRMINRGPDDRYRLVKEIIADPHEPCLLVRTRLEAEPDLLATLRVFVLCAPHLNVGGAGNTGEVVSVDERRLLLAHKGDTWMALSASVPLARASAGYVGVNDGWTDLHDNFQMDWEYDCALDGNIALMGELDLTESQEWTLALAFGQTFHHVVTTLFQSLSIPYDAHRERFLDQWQRACDHQPALEEASEDGGGLYHRSHSLLLAHEDKRYPGAMIASLSIPWGEVKDDEEGDGGYHLVWTRDMVNSAMGLIATGNTSTPLRSLIYLAIAQEDDGGFPQNFWVNGEPYWRGVQLDEVAFPILLAWRLHCLDALQHFDPYPMMRRAAGFLIRRGPATPQERWEEASGYSPSTLAAVIAALTCTACMMRERGDPDSARFVQEYADFLECHIEAWTVTTEGTLVPEIPRHFIRIHPVDPDERTPNENPNQGTLRIANRPPDARAEFPGKEIVDAGFLELVRYGIRAPDDPLIQDSLRVVDAVLKVETPFGPCWRRYNHDGYGQKPDGGAFEGWGKGRVWPLLTGERAHYELAAGRPVQPLIRAMERFGHAIGVLSEQLWDEEDLPDKHLFFGRPTGAAMPLMWAHAEYIKLLRSVADGQVFDFLPAVAERYLGTRDHPKLEIWKPNRHSRTVARGWTLRIQAPAPFHLHWTTNEWQDEQQARATGTALGIEWVDIPIGAEQQAPVRFAFRWLDDGEHDQREYQVEVVEEPA